MKVSDHSMSEDDKRVPACSACSSSPGERFGRNEVEGMDMSARQAEEVVVAYNVSKARKSSKNPIIISHVEMRHGHSVPGRMVK